ncbi:hypothetical protein [Streptomyces sp. NPDC060031]|uniref:hypothetical protein n=1 Tax=Streptomyces sp. NPDC060031 TaxID=3347043 RepID=UPI00369EB140
MEQVARELVRTLVFGDTERPLTIERKRAATGPRAVRVPVGADDQRVFVPCAYAGPGLLPHPGDR